MRSSTYFAAFPLWKAFRELSSAGSERLPYKQRVGGSNPSAPTNERRRLRFLKRLFLFSGRVGSVGAGRVGVVSAGRCGSVRVGVVGAGRAGRGGRCGSRRSVRVEVDGAGRCGRCGPGRDEADWAGPASAGRLVRNEAAGGLRVCHGGPRAHCCRYRVCGLDVLVRRCGRPGAPLPLSCYRVRAAADSRLRPSSLAACCMLCSFRGSSIFGIARPSLSSTPLTLRALRRPRCGAGR